MNNEVIRDLTEEEKDILQLEIDRLDSEIFINQKKLERVNIFSLKDKEVVNLKICELQKEREEKYFELRLGIYFPWRW